MKAIAYNGESYLVEKEDGNGCMYNPDSGIFGQDHRIISLLNKSDWEWLDKPFDIEK